MDPRKYQYQYLLYRNVVPLVEELVDSYEDDIIKSR